MRIVAEELELTRNDRRLFAGVGFSLESGEALALTGPNGSGKSSLIRAALGFLPFTHGKIRLEGAKDANLAESTHYIGHQDGMKTSLTAAENLDFWAAMLGAAHMAPRAALAELGLAHVEKAPVAYLSAGQRRRVALARLLVAHRDIWMLDEPTTALDAATQALFAAICARHLREGGLIIAATHLDLGFRVRQLALGGQP